jgi:succinate dehydrogenase / fumarate reductase, cytochrome b subunit
MLRFSVFIEKSFMGKKETSAKQTSVMQPSAPVPRPLSPHLTIYKPQMTSGMSIFHKATGVLLMGVLIVLVAWLVCLAWLPAWYPYLLFAATSLIGRIVLIGMTWVYFYHFSCGVRHLLWAAGWCMSLRDIYWTAYAALAVSFLATAGVWVVVLGVG